MQNIILFRIAIIIIYYNNDKCLLVLVTYISLCFISLSLFFFFQKADDNILKKNPVAQKFVKLFFCFCLN